MPSTRRKKLAAKKEQIRAPVPVLVEEDPQTASNAIPDSSSQVEDEVRQEVLPASNSAQAAEAVYAVQQATSQPLPPQEATVPPPITSVPVGSLEVQVLTKTAISKLVSRTCESVEIAMKMMERRLQGSAGECDNIMWNEIQKVESESRKRICGGCS